MKNDTYQTYKCQISVRNVPYEVIVNNSTQSLFYFKETIYLLQMHFILIRQYVGPCLKVINWWWVQNDMNINA
jgi:hypothetical protein